MSMLSGMKIKRRKSGTSVPLTSLTPTARASGNPELSDDQREIVAAWLSLPKPAQRAIVIAVMEDGRDAITADDVSGGAPEAPAQPSPDQVNPESEDPSSQDPMADPEELNADSSSAAVVENGLWAPDEDDSRSQSTV